MYFRAKRVLLRDLKLSTADDTALGRAADSLEGRERDLSKSKD